MRKITKEMSTENVNTENSKLPLQNVVCRLFNDRNGTTDLYKGAVYTKLDGTYGYLCVEGFKVLFFWCEGACVCCDELDYFRVCYESAG